MEIIRPTFLQFRHVPSLHVYNIPRRLGAGFIRLETFSSGLHLMYMDLKLTKPIRILGETNDWNFGISFNMVGHSEVRASGYKQISARSGSSIHYAYPGVQRIEEDIGITRKSKMAILFNPETLFHLAKEDEEPFLPFLEGYKNHVSVAGQNVMALDVEKEVSQLITCPYSGKTRSLFMEGKTMELFAQMVEQLRKKNRCLSRQPRVNATDIERIRHAAELLVRDPANPPDLTNLAGQIGMSRSKFYHTFKVVFEHSPMEHLRRHRLHIAKRLLQQGEHNVTEVAFAVGFNSPSYFTKTFHAEFGISPRQVI